MVRNMNKYATASALVGVLQVVDASNLAHNTGVATSLTMPMATVESIWAIMSLVVAIRARHRATRYLASGFILYIFTGLVGSFFLEFPTNSIPMLAVYAGGVFGILYAAASIYVASSF